MTQRKKILEFLFLMPLAIQVMVKFEPKIEEHLMKKKSKFTKTYIFFFLVLGLAVSL